MPWSSKDFDPPMLSAALKQAANFSQSQEPKAEAKDISEYSGRMQALGLEKMGQPCWVSVVNLYLNQGDLERHKAKGALVLYLETEDAGKIFQSAGLEFPSDEDDASMIAASGQLAQKVAEAFKNELAGHGYVSLVLSTPATYKNNAVGGVEYSSDQKTKHELSFFYLKSKVICIDLTLAPIPKK